MVKQQTRHKLKNSRQFWTRNEIFSTANVIRQYVHVGTEILAAGLTIQFFIDARGQPNIEIFLWGRCIP